MRMRWQRLSQCTWQFVQVVRAQSRAAGGLGKIVTHMVAIMPTDANTQKTWVPSSRLLIPAVGLDDGARMSVPVGS
jgi:hypothetical protein